MNLRLFDMRSSKIKDAVTQYFIKFVKFVKFVV